MAGKPTKAAAGTPQHRCRRRCCRGIGLLPVTRAPFTYSPSTDRQSPSSRRAAIHHLTNWPDAGVPLGRTPRTSTWSAADRHWHLFRSEGPPSSRGQTSSSPKLASFIGRRSSPTSIRQMYWVMTSFATSTPTALTLPLVGEALVTPETDLHLLRHRGRLHRCRLSCGKVNVDRQAPEAHRHVNDIATSVRGTTRTRKAVPIVSSPWPCRTGDG